MSNVLVNVPARARRGEIVEIKTLVSHVMETGYRRTQVGGTIPRDIIRLFVCTYNGAEVFRAELHPAISANTIRGRHSTVVRPAPPSAYIRTRTDARKNNVTSSVHGEPGSRELGRVSSPFSVFCQNTR